MHLIAERHRRGWRAAAIDTELLIVSAPLRRIKLIGFVRNIAILSARTKGQRHVGTRAREVVVGDNCPGNAELFQNWNHPFGKAGFRRDISARCGSSPEDLHLTLMNLQDRK